MCFISFGSISGSINVSDGIIFDVYLFSDCLNENLLFCKTFLIHSEYARLTKLHIGKTNPESLEEIQRSASRKSFKFTCGIFMQGK